MTAWFRFYSDALNDPKIQRLPGDVFKFWVNLLCIACAGSGRLPSLADIAFALRLPEAKAAQTVEILKNAGLLDEDSAGLFPHNWAGRQFQSDHSKERVKRHRERPPPLHGRYNAVTVAVTEPLLSRPQIQIQSQSQKQNPSLAASSPSSAREGAAEEDARNFHKICDLLGYDSRDSRNWSVFIRMLTTDGLAFQSQVLPAAERLAKSGNSGKTMGYLRKAAEDEKTRAPAPDAPPPEFEDTDGHGWQNRVRVFREKGLWSAKWGPRPGEAGCRVPALAESHSREAA